MTTGLHIIEYTELSKYIVDNNWTNVYVSIGGKINRHSQYNEEIKFVNSEIHIVPHFIRDNMSNEISKTLVIVFDDFSKQHGVFNKEIIESITNNNNNNNNLHICLVNTLITFDLFKIFWNTLRPSLYTNNISPDNFKIISYVKYLNVPNANERTNCKIPNFIYNVIKEDNVYSECMYEWIGYNKRLHEYACNYRIIQNNGLNNGVNILLRLLENYEKSGKTSDSIKINNLNVIHILDNLIPLTSNLPVYTLLNCEKECVNDVSY